MYSRPVCLAFQKRRDVWPRMDEVLIEKAESFSRRIDVLTQAHNPALRGNSEAKRVQRAEFEIDRSKTTGRKTKINALSL